MVSSPYAAAPDDKLDEIIRLAEARLAAQLTLGLAADQRAMTFASFLAAIAAALITAISTLQHPGGAIWMLTVGFVGAALMSIWSAQPIPWDIPGYRPGHWIGDIVEGDSLKNGRAAMAEHYDEAIIDNDAIMKANANWLRAALVVIVVATVLAGGLAAIA